MLRVVDTTGQEWMIKDGDRYSAALKQLEKDGLDLKDLILPRGLLMFGKSGQSEATLRALYDNMDDREAIINAVIAYRLEHD